MSSYPAPADMCYIIGRGAADDSKLFSFLLLPVDEDKEARLSLYPLPPLRVWQRDFFILLILRTNNNNEEVGKNNNAKGRLSSYPTTTNTRCIIVCNALYYRPKCSQ